MAEKKFVGIAADFINAMKLNFIGKGADPNSIIVQDLYRFDPGESSGKLANSILKDKKELLFNQLSKENREILETLLHVYNDKINTKRELLTQARRLYETDVVQTMIDVMIDDGFNSFANEKEEFKIEYDLDEDEVREGICKNCIRWCKDRPYSDGRHLCDRIRCYTESDFYCKYFSKGD